MKPRPAPQVSPPAAVVSARPYATCDSQQRTNYVYRKRRWLTLFSFLDGIGGQFHQPALGVPDLTHARSILVLKLDQIGDVVLTQPLLLALRRAAPGARIDLVVGAGRGPVASLLPGADAIRELPVRMRGSGLKTNPFVLWKRGRLERALRPDVVVAAKDEPLTALVAYLIGAPLRVGYREGGLGFLLTHHVPITGSRPQYEELAALAGPAGGVAQPPEVQPRDADRKEVETLLEALAIRRERPLIVVHPGSGDRAMRWEWSRFAEALHHVCTQCPADVLVIGAEELSARPSLDLPPPSRAAIPQQPLSIPVLAALLASADVFLGNESGPSHLAAAAGTPSVVPFLSGNDPRRWGPAAPLGHPVVGPVGVGPEPVVVAEVLLAALAGNPNRAPSQEADVPSDRGKA